MNPEAEFFKRSIREQAARQAYCIYAYQTGQRGAWEHLDDAHQTAWKEVVELLLGDAPCLHCGEPLQCVVCDYEPEEPECPDCGEEMVCPFCHPGLVEDAAPAAQEKTE